jgi:heme O synthase-like polyprenyltransferase
MNCLSANALVASHADALAVSSRQSVLLLPYLVVTVVFTVMTISVHLPVSVPMEDAWIYGAIALSTFIGLLLPGKDLNDANSTIDDEMEDSPSSFLRSYFILMCLFTMLMMKAATL